MSSKLFRSIENLHKESSVIFSQRDTDKLYIINGYTFNKVFKDYIFLPVDFRKKSLDHFPLDGIKLPDNLEVHIRIKDQQIFFETEDYDLINVE
jgi:hypothetical protein